MRQTLSLPFGIRIELRSHSAAVTASRLEREFYVPTDDLDSKAEAARIAFEELLCCLARVGFNVDSAPGRLAIEAAAEGAPPKEADK